MDGDEIVMAMFLGCGLILLLFAMVMLADKVFNDPFAAENALIQCTDRGFDYADSYDKPILSQQATGVKCAYVSYEQKDVDVQSDNSKTVVIT